MSGFVFNPPNSDSEPPVQPPPADAVMFDGWWPNMNLTAVRDAIRIDTTVAPDRLRDAVRQAMLDIAAALTAWRAEQEAAGYESLAAVPARIMVDGVSDYVLRFNRAVYSVVGADLAERQIGSRLTSAGADRADELSADIDIHTRNVTWAVRDFLGRTRVIAEAL
jgi:hypothetical protein